jgi:hypothetical protein
MWLVIDILIVEMTTAHAGALAATKWRGQRHANLAELATRNISALLRTPSIKAWRSFLSHTGSKRPVTLDFFVRWSNQNVPTKALDMRETGNSPGHGVSLVLQCD